MSVISIDVRAQLDAVVCRPCGGPKPAGKPFCADCHAALPLEYRLSLADDAQEWFGACARHLELNANRIRRSHSRPWPYRTLAELEQEGFKLSGYGWCKARCDARVVFFWTPDRRRRICLNGDDYQPHSGMCADPGWHQRRRAVKTSARRKKSA